jgi:Phosphotransferase enzyme family
MGIGSPAVYRTVTLVLVDAEGRATGTLPPFEVELPYWQEVADVVAGAVREYGVEVTVLRLLSAQLPHPPGGAVTYLAQTDRVPPAFADRPDLDDTDHPNRADYARPGGPAASLRWAADALAALGRGPVTTATQLRTWNLSTIWRLETPTGSAWLKQVPRFFAHEPAVLRWLTGDRVPLLLAADDAGRMLLDHIDGEDLYGAGRGVRSAIAVDMHRIHVTAARRTPELLAIGVPDRRAAPLLESITATVAAHGAGDPRLTALVDGLPARLAEVAACGLPDTLVHGDLHPGNVRGRPTDPGNLVLIDWGDSSVGHPAFDILRLTDELSDVDAAVLIGEWSDRWRAEIAGCRPERAVDLLRPVAALRGAVTYADFLDRIEPAEHPYHAIDVSACLQWAADLAA